MIFGYICAIFIFTMCVCTLMWLYLDAVVPKKKIYTEDGRPIYAHPKPWMRFLDDNLPKVIATLFYCTAFVIVLGVVLTAFMC